jgi:hypothetical protein
MSSSFCPAAVEQDVLAEEARRAVIISQCRAGSRVEVVQRTGIGFKDAWKLCSKEVRMCNAGSNRGIETESAAAVLPSRRN